MDRFTELETFVRIVESGSIGKAAEQMNLAKSAVSRRLKDLETRLSTTLVIRSPRSLGLTVTGASFYDRAKVILRDLEQAEETASSTSIQQALQGTIRLTAPLSFGNNVLAPVLNRFLEKHPEVDLDLELTDRRLDLIESGFDLALRTGDLDDSQIVSRRVLSFDRSACASPSYLEKHGVPSDLDDLVRHHIGLTSSNLPERTYWTFFDLSGQDLVAKPSTRIKANNGDAVLRAAEAGLGISVVPRFISWKSVQDGKLVEILGNYRTRTEAVHLLYPPGRHLSKRVRALADDIIDALREPYPWGLQSSDT